MIVHRGLPQQPRSLRRDAKIKAWNQNNNKGGDARVERSSTAAVTGMMSPQDWWTAGTKGEHHREDLDISGHPKRRRSFPRRQKGETSEAANQPTREPAWASARNQYTIRRHPPQRRRNYRVTDLSVLNLYHCNNVPIISRHIEIEIEIYGATSKQKRYSLVSNSKLSP